VRLRWDGIPLGGGEFVIAGWPAVTGGKTGYLVAWEDVGPGALHHEVMGRLAGHFLWLPVVRRP